MQRFVVSGFLVAILAFTWLPTAQADHEEDTETLWMHIGDNNGLVFSFDKEDERHAKNEYYRNFLTWAGGATVTNNGVMEPIPEKAIELVPGRTVRLGLTIGSSNGWFATWGSFESTLTMLVNGETFATGPAQEVVLPTGGSSAHFETLIWDVVPTATVIPAEASVTFRIQSTGGPSSDYVIASGDSPGWTYAELPVKKVIPVKAAEPVNIWRDLEGFDVTFDAVQATSGTLHYNWTQAQDANVWAQGNVTSGTVHLQITDASGVIVYGEFLDDLKVAGERMAEIRNASAGPWTGLVTLKDFTGDVHAWLLPVAPDGTEVNLPPGTGNKKPDNTKLDDETTQSTDDAGEESPGLGILAALVLLAGLAARRRS